MVWNFFSQFQGSTPTSNPPTSNPPTSNPPTSAPPTSQPPTSQPPTSQPPTGQPGSCTATYRMVNGWPGGYQGEVTVSNTSGTGITGWTVHLTLASGQTIGTIWSGTNSGTSGDVTVRNASYNGAVGAGASTSFGFIVNGANSTAPGNLSCTSS